MVAHHTLPLHCIEAKVPGTNVTINCVLNSGSEIITMPRHIWEKIGLPLCCDHLMTMTSANMSKDTTVGILENLKLNFRARPVMHQVQVIEHANFDILLGCPFICLMSAVTNNYPDCHNHWITLCDLNDGHKYTLPTCPWCKGCPCCKCGKHCHSHQSIVEWGF
ncbi:hypothetical protein BKA82DRAFT_132919 [Pisolithus tinctorius]|uniref:Peptidase A2 domain-containing protein n=1 Tax=Pisolithus tinctorius Marx 270 TaxID=870435 RepID=A0A0C3PL08_PISTI|nr:hypothetical protein BKA82DRAFT_132919 [Pisolithus tinctorius]KIO08954.1 hypothetical protein M404DRAFT_132919 [Pisolithus tinctorius Marx 270]